MKKNIIYIAIIIVCTIISVPRGFQNDTFFGITVGDSIIEDGFYNIKNTTIHDGLNYKSIHPIFDIIISLLNKYLGFKGIYFFVVSIAIVTMISIYFILYKLKIPKFFSICITLAILVCGNMMFTGRAQIISFLLMGYLVYCVEKLLQTNKNRYIVYLVLLHFAIANFHTSIFLLSFLIYIPYIFEFWVRKYGKLGNDLTKYRFIFETYDITKLLIAIAISLVIGILNPYGVYVYTYLFTTLNGVASKYIAELQKPDIAELLSYSPYVVIVFIGLFTTILFSKARIKLVDFVMVLMYCLASLIANRYSYYLIYVGYFSIARLLICFVRSLNEEKYQELINYKFSKIEIFVILLVVIEIFSTKITLGEEGYVPKSSYPVEATKWIKENLDYENIRIYNSYECGSYIAFEGIPIFIDSRAELFDTKDVTVLREIYDMINMKMKCQELFEKYDLEYAVVSRYESIYKCVSENKDYTEIYNDENFEIYKLK